MGIQDKTSRGYLCCEAICDMASVPPKCGNSQEFLLKIKMYLTPLKITSVHLSLDHIWF